MNSKQEKWFALEITVVSDAAEAVEFALNELDSSGTEINNLGKTRSETIEIIGYFNEKLSDETVQNELNEALRIYNLPAGSIEKFGWREVENQDWLTEWKKHWRPTETAKFIVAPVWSEIEPTEKFIIRIEPSMAFGTGTHETTRLCLRAIEENYSPEMSFLDVGTGTGILAVGAAKIQGKRQKAKGEILACDTDFDSVEIAKENAVINDAENIEFYAGSISDDTPEFDFVCANLTADVIVPLLPLLTAKTKQILVLSGILKEQEEIIISELEKFQIINPKIETDGEWISVQVRNEK